MAQTLGSQVPAVAPAVYEVFDRMLLSGQWHGGRAGGIRKIVIPIRIRSGPHSSRQ